jgi:hypothetical protein
VLTTIFLASQVIAVGAAPTIQEAPPISGTVVEITKETDSATNVTTVLVTLDDGSEVPLVVRLSFDDATELGLLNLDGTVNEGAKNTEIDIPADQVISDTPEEPGEEAQHPVGLALSDFFSELLGVDYDTIMEAHEDGVGFGVIAQALWMTNTLVSDEDAEMSPEELFAAILLAKQNHEYGDITLPDGSTPENWGQFKKAVMQDREKAKENLGAIMSGHAENGQGEELLNQEQIQTQDEVQSNGNAPDKNKDKGNNGKGPDKVKNNNGKNNQGNPH